MKTQAAILVEQRQPLVVDEIEVPALSYGQVLVEISATRICGSQLGEIEGVKGPDRYLPHLLGHEAGGTVLEIGPEVRQVKVGDRVVVHWRPGKGIEARPAQYRWGSRTVNAGWVTTFSRLSVISENRLTPVPPDTDFETCALLADTITTGFGVINNDASVKIGEAVVIIGVGGIGLGTVLGAKLAGAHPIIAVDIHKHKLDKALEVGATHAVDCTTQDFTTATRELLNGAAPEVVIDGTGRPETIEKAYALVGAEGRCVIVGVMPHDKKLQINTLPLHFGKTLTGSHGGRSRPDIEIPRYMRMLKGGLFDLKNFVTHRFSLDQVNEGIEKMKEGEVIHSIILF